MLDVEPYIGVPWRERGRTPNEGWDCWGAYRWVLRETLGVELPSLDGAYTDADPQRDPGERHRRAKLLHEWVEVLGVRVDGAPQPGDALVFRMFGAPVHYGCYVGEGLFLHVPPGTQTCLERMDSPKWQPRLLGIYRPRALA